MLNCIVWGNPNCTSLSRGTLFKVFDSCIEGGFTGTQMHVVTANPRMENAAMGDYRLRHSSPCVDAGVNASLPVMPGVNATIDFAGQPRIVHGTVDMGAFEGFDGSYCAADIAPASVTGPGGAFGNDAVDIDDLLLVIANWNAGPGSIADINHDDVVNI